MSQRLFKITFPIEAEKIKDTLTQVGFLLERNSVKIAQKK